MSPVLAINPVSNKNAELMHIREKEVISSISSFYITKFYSLIAYTRSKLITTMMN